MFLAYFHYNSEPSFKLELNGEQIPSSDSMKYLGLTFQSNIKWSTHITNIVKKSNRTLGMLRRCLSGASSRLKLIAFNTVTRPILEYASQVWSPHEKGLIDQIDKVHRRALRWIFHVPKIASLTDLMQVKKIPTLADRRADQDTTFLRKIEFGLYDIQLERYITQNTLHDTRHKTINPHYRMNQFKHSFYNRVNDQVKILFSDRKIKD
jgi:hypothetical protein